MAEKPVEVERKESEKVRALRRGLEEGEEAERAMRTPTVERKPWEGGGGLSGFLGRLGKRRKIIL